MIVAYAGHFLSCFLAFDFFFGSCNCECHIFILNLRHYYFELNPWHSYYNEPQFSVVIAYVW